MSSNGLQPRDTGGVLALSAEDLAVMLGLSLRKIRRMDAAGFLPRPVRLGRSVRWPIEEIKRWLAAGGPDRRTWEKMGKRARSNGGNP